MTVWLCFEAHAPDGRIWAVKAGRQWHTAASVESLGVEWSTVYRPQGRQPKAYLRGQARSVVQHGETVYIAG